MFLKLILQVLNLVNRFVLSVDARTAGKRSQKSNLHILVYKSFIIVNYFMFVKILQLFLLLIYFDYISNYNEHLCLKACINFVRNSLYVMYKTVASRLFGIYFRDFSLRRVFSQCIQGLVKGLQEVDRNIQVHEQ